MPKPAVLTPRSEDFPRWYQDVVAKAELADNGPVRGTMVVRPYGYAIWERMQVELDARIKAIGARNAYFPLLIPESYLRREAEHVEGFSPELAVVTHGGGKKLEEAAVVRPTSETVINVYFAKWIQSWRDLPMMLNQWANVVRWEMRPRLFLRTSEFLWQEGHTAHASEEDARDLALRVLTDVYEDFILNVMAIPVLAGRKTERERFAGATTTWACEAMMGDGRALQLGTSHELGQNFSRAFGIEFQTVTGQTENVWQTSWGVSTRLLGGLIMAHGDDNGLRLPPRIAPVQAVVILARQDERAGRCAADLAGLLQRSGVRAELDADTDSSFGRRVTDWELKGVPVRLEVGPRDLAEKKVTLVRRDSMDKTNVGLDDVVAAVTGALEEAHHCLLSGARERQEARTVEAQSLEEAKQASQVGFARVPWSAVGVEGETALAAEGVSVRCLRMPDGSLPRSASDEEDLVADIARAY